MKIRIRCKNGDISDLDAINVTDDDPQSDENFYAINTGFSVKFFAKEDVFDITITN